MVLSIEKQTEVLNSFVPFKSTMENELGHKIKALVQIVKMNLPTRN